MRSNVQSTPVVGQAVVVKKKQQHKDVIYPIFARCAEIEESPEWKQQFEDLARGILPKGFNVRNKTLAYTDSSKTIPIRMDLEPEALREELINLFSNKKGILKRVIKKHQAPTQIPSKWSEVKKKISRRTYIITYVATKGLEMGWSQSLVDEAVAQVGEWLTTGQVRMNEVDFEDGHVLGVRDVELTEDGITLRDTPDRKIRCSIQTVHVSRLYQRLRPQHSKREKVEDKEEGSTTTSVSVSG
jgi:hypothetical protein